MARNAERLLTRARDLSAGDTIELDGIWRRVEKAFLTFDDFANTFGVIDRSDQVLTDAANKILWEADATSTHIRCIGQSHTALNLASEQGPLNAAEEAAGLLKLMERTRRAEHLTVVVLSEYIPHYVSPPTSFVVLVSHAPVTYLL